MEFEFLEEEQPWGQHVDCKKKVILSAMCIDNHFPHNEQSFPGNLENLCYLEALGIKQTTAQYDCKE
jgi:hypothetical protein